MSLVVSRYLEHKGKCLVPNLFEDLLGAGRLKLLEVGNPVHSVLVQTFVARTGQSDSACQSGLWSSLELASPEGLGMVLEQVHTLKPRHVWIALPGEAFSTLQNLNQRTPTQIRDLKAKRALAMKAYQGTVELVKTCVQLGVHVSVELSERSEAWRLPILQDLRFRMGLHGCVVKGCSVGLKDSEGRLFQKGWRILTTHTRLAEMLNKPCRCHMKYNHAKCEGKEAQHTRQYTGEFGRLVYEALSREGDCDKVLEECSGKSRLPEEFGLGLGCVCGAKPVEEPCGRCVLVHRQEGLFHQGSPEAPKAHSLMATSEIQSLEIEAKRCREHQTDLDLVQPSEGQIPQEPGFH